MNNCRNGHPQTPENVGLHEGYPYCRMCNRNRNRRRALENPLAEAWRGMIRRCEDPRSKDFANYGANGVKVCERWHRFDLFASDMGQRPGDHLLDRIDPFGNYEPTNCRWLPVRLNSQNRRNSRLNTEAVKVIRWAKSNGRRTRDLAAIFKIRPNHIQEVVSGRIWK